MRQTITIFLLLVITQSFIFARAEKEETRVTEEEFFAENAKRSNVKVLPSGAQYTIMTAGKGKYHAGPDSILWAQHTEQLQDGTLIDSSYSRGSQAEFIPSNEIKGLEEVLQMMVLGDKWIIYVPAKLAYGEKGREGVTAKKEGETDQPPIPPNHSMIFKIEVHDIVGEKILSIPCVPSTREGCTKKENVFIGKMVKSFGDRLDGMEEEVARLHKLLQEGNMKPDLVEWFETRVAILKKMMKGGVGAGTGAGSDEL
mmetsp:Transcript_29805/g.68399  ORF Transcript_29805/g.68399 Transcript_29805/m.68399 type:complete len:256 (-) Transcript_29805:595-1362(-)